MDVMVVGAGVASPILDHPADVLRGPVTPSAPFDPGTLLGGRGWRYKDRATQLAALAAARALVDASLLDAARPDESLHVPGETVGAAATSNLGNLDTVCRTAAVIASSSAARTSPLDLPNASSNVVASSIAVRYGLRGPNLMVTNGASSGLDAVYLAAVLIAAGRVVRMVVVGVEPMNEVVAELAGGLAGKLFDGAAALVLESAAAAARRRAAGFRVGGYARRADPAGSVTRALGDRPPPGLWLAEATTAAPAAVRDVPRRGLEPALGAASGALGVLQLVAGLHWLGNGGRGAVLATAGAADDGTSSLLLARAEGAP
jgi:3-oxoacyl-[acyl-carrier-protein] synthase II